MHSSCGLAPSWWLAQPAQRQVEHGQNPDCPSQVLRTFGHIDGYGTIIPVTNPIQPTVGVFNETALMRYDFVMDALAQVGAPRVLVLWNGAKLCPLT